MRPQILMSAMVLVIGAALILLTAGQAPHFLFGQLLELYGSWAGQSASDRPSWAPYLEAASLLAVGGPIFWALAVKRRRTALVLTVIGLLVVWGGSLALYTSGQLLIDPVYPSATALLAFAVYWIVKATQAAVSRRRVRSAFGNQLSPGRARLLAASQGRSYIEAERKTVTVLSCRILNVRAFYEAFETDPNNLIRLLKELRRLTRDSVLSQDGTVDRSTSDRLTAFWNAPLDDPEHARHACLSAFETVEKVDALNRRIQAEISPSGATSFPVLRVGIGIETGPAFLGALGTGQRIGYTALGETVEQAARLQRQSINYGTSIVVGQETRRFVTDLPLLELDRVILKGQKQSTKIYGLLEPRLVASENAYQAHQLIHNAMLHAYRQQNWQEAASYLERCHGFCDALEKLYSIYSSRIEYYGSAPPDSTWDGSIVSAGG